MPRTKLLVSAPALGRRKKPFHVNVAANTTSAQVVGKVLEKLQCRDPSLRYQLWAAAAEREQLLRDDDLPVAVKEQWAEQGVEPEFQLRLRASGIVRIQHRLDGDQETFRSLIVTPHMMSGDVVQVALAQIAPHETVVYDYQLLEKTPHGERVVGDEECPLMLQTGATQLMLRKKSDPPPLNSPELSPTDHTPLSATSTTGHTPSALSVQRSWLSMHQDLVTALSHFTSALQQPTSASRPGTREKVLEQSLVQQNQIVDMLQKMVGSLEAENELVREKMSHLEHKVRGLKMWKARARMAEERLREMVDSSGVLGSSQSGVISFSALTSFEKILAEKDKQIASLQSRVEGGEEREGEAKPPPVTTRLKLAAERVKVLELEEHLLSSREASRKAVGQLSDYQSDIMRRESEIQYLRHAIEAGRKMSLQQQDVVMGLRAGLLDRDAQITSLTRALERASEEGRRRPAAGRHPGSTQQSMFDLVLGREVFTIELKRDPQDRELGISVSRFEMPVSSRMSSLIVRAVREGSVAGGLLIPGDEILEVNGLNCRSPGSQKKAVQALETAAGALRIVAAREQGPAQYVGRIRSTPIISESSQSTLWATANDSSFAPMSPSDNSLSSPQHYHLSLSSSPGSAPPHSVPLASHIRPQPIGQVKTLEPSSPEKPPSNREDADSMREDEVAETEEVQQLRSEATHYQTVQAELEAELDSAHSELEDLRMEHRLMEAENYDLQQQVKASGAEMAEIQGQVEELQQLLLGVREKVGREEERTSALEEQNTELHRELAEANTARDTEKQHVAEVRGDIVQLKLDFENEKSELTTKIATLQSHNEQLQSEVRARTVETESAKAQVAEFEGRVESERREAGEQLEQLRADLQQLREQSAKDTSSSQIETEKLQSQFTSTQILLSTAEKRESEQRAELLQLRQAIDETTKQLTELEITCCSLREEMAGVREQAETKTLECESLTLGLRRAEGKLYANKDTSSRQREEIENLRQKNKKLLIERVKADEERSKAEVALRISRSEQAQAREKLQSQSGERDELFSELEDLVAENTSLQQQLDSARESLEAQGARSELTHQLEQLQCDLDRAREAEQEMRGEREALVNELALERSKTEQLKASLSTVEAALEGVETGKKKSEDLISSMMFVHEQDQTRLRDMEVCLSKAQSGLEEVRREAGSEQERLNQELQGLVSETAGLRERISGLESQLAGERETRASEVETLKKTLTSSEQTVGQLQAELVARESANSINQATISQLQSAAETAEQERDRAQQSLKDLLRQSHQGQVELDVAQTHSRGLETENASLASERDSLRETCVDLRSSLKQNSSQADSLAARLQAAQGNLSENQQRLEEATTSGREMKNKLADLEREFRQSEANLEKAESRVQEVTLSLHKREGEVSQLKTQLEMYGSERSEVQISLSHLQTTTAAQEKAVGCLETERDSLRETVDQLRGTQDGLRGLITSLEKERSYTAEQHSLNTASLTQQLEEKTAAEAQHLGKIQQLERLYGEARMTAEGLLAAQEALRSSLTTLGDEREGEGEVVRLREQLVGLEADLAQSQQEASGARSREEALEIEVSATRRAAETATSRASELEERLEEVREEREELRETETHLTHLQGKVEALEESQRERSSKMVTLQTDLETASRELASVREENAALMERVGEVAAMNVTLAEKTAELERVRGELAAEVKGRQEAVNEKEQLLTVLRRSEVERHTASAAASTELSSTLQEADREQLVEAARDKEEEAVRLREYVGKLLSAVVDKAPFVLEKM